MYECIFPFPPSINAAYGGGSGQRRFKTKAYKAWEDKCADLPLPANGVFEGPISISYVMYMPDKRIRDIGNYEKLITDRFVSQGIIKDDNWNIVQEIIIRFGGLDRSHPRVTACVKKMQSMC